MKKRILLILTVVALGLTLTACGDSNKGNANNGNQGNNTGAVETNKPDNNTGETDADTDKGEASTEKSTEEISEAILTKIEQPNLMLLEEEMVKDTYALDLSLLEQYTIKVPMMNVKTNEIAVFKVKDAKDIPAVEEAIKQRALNVQKQFETYLPDQYENAKNYKLVTEGNYVLFVISEVADQIVEEFQSLVK